MKKPLHVLLVAACALGITGRVHAQVPTITSFTAAPASIAAGQNAALAWVVSGASGLSINNGVGTVTGTNLTVSPVVTTTYTLTATNAAGASIATATVAVGPLPRYDWVYLGVRPAVSGDFVAADVADLPALVSKLTNSVSAVGAWLMGQWSVATRVALTDYQTAPSIQTNRDNLQSGLLLDLNALIRGASIYDATIFSGVRLRPETQQLITQNPQGTELVRQNRLLIEDAYPGELSQNLQGTWRREAWEDLFNPLATDFAAAAPGRPGRAVEVRFGTQDSYGAFGFIDAIDGWIYQNKYLNEYRTIEFDIYFEADSYKSENLMFFLQDAGVIDPVYIVDLIPGWAELTSAQRLGRWFHVAVDLRQFHPQIPHFVRFLFRNNSKGELPSALPHFRITDVRLGFLDDTTPPVVTLGSASLSPNLTQLTLNFATDELARYRIEYGLTNYSTVLLGPLEEWRTNHSVTLVNLAPNTTWNYRIVALDHRTDTNALPNEGIYTNSFTIPSIPTTPPVITGLAASGVLGYRATVVWITDRACAARLTYHKAGGANLTRTFPELTASHACLLDLLEPVTTYSVTVTTTDAFGLSASQAFAFTTGMAGVPTVTITATPGPTHRISPWIYGINYLLYEWYALGWSSPEAPRNVTMNRSSGNRWTTYNWENNAVNAGSDWYYTSDDGNGGGEVPGEAVRSRIDEDRARGMASLVTLQLQGYVAADKNGKVNLADPTYFTNRFKEVVYRKGAAFTATPSTTDAFVYMDEFLWTLRGKFTNDIFADPVTPTFVSLDNEPELWNSTHLEVQRTKPTTADYIQRTIALASALKDAVPTVQLFGPANYGFNGLVNFQSDVTTAYSADYWFVDKYLTELRVASEAVGKRLIDVYDFHWYSSAEYDPGIPYVGIGTLIGTNLTDTQIQAIVQSPRSLWDATYREDSWIFRYLADQNLGAPVNILGRLQAKIDARWPGTKLAITEYENGGSEHIAGAIAQADNLGIFGSFGVFAATFWPTNLKYPFVVAAFKMYRDYDGQLGSFGDISIPASSSDIAKVATYVSQDSSRSNRYVIVAINRSPTAQDVNFSGLALSGVARVYRIEGTQTTPVFVGEVPVNLATWVVTLPPLSVSTIEILRQESFADWQASVFSAAEQQNPAISGPGVDPDGGSVPNLLRFAFGLPPRGPVSSQILPQMLPSGGANYFGIQFNRRSVAPGLTYVIEGSSTLTNWTVLETILPGDPTRTTILDTAPMGSNRARFLRIGVRYTP